MPKKSTNDKLREQALAGNQSSTDPLMLMMINQMQNPKTPVTDNNNTPVTTFVFILLLFGLAALIFYGMSKNKLKIE